MEKLKEPDSQQAAKIKEQLEKIKQNTASQETKKKIDKLKEELSAKPQESKKKPKEGSQEENPWEIYVLPSRVVLAVGNSVSLKAIAVYNKVFIKELNSAMEWFSSNRSVVEVSRVGVVSALREGEARVGTSYKGKDSELSQIIVVGRTTTETEGLVKKELGEQN